MAFVTPRMSLKIWNAAQDPYDHEQLADNFLKLDQHDHSQGRGVAIGSAGIQSGAIQLTHLSSTVANSLSTQVVTSLPASPVDGQQIFYVADETNGIIWNLKYRAYQADGVTPNASAYKWQVLGGNALYTEVQAQQILVASTVYADLSTVGPQLTAPLAGDYEIEFGGLLGAPGGGSTGYMSISVNGATALDADAASVYSFPASAEVDTSVMARRRKTITAANTAVVTKYRSTAGNTVAARRWLALMPRRVG